MNTILAILQLFPTILSAITAVENVVPIPGQGKAKLDLILGIVKTAYDGAAGLEKSFAWDKLAGLVTTIVGQVVGFLNAVGVFKTPAA